MLENINSTLKIFLDSVNISSPVSREHYLQRCLPVVNTILNRKEKVTVIDAGCGHAYESIFFSALGADVIGIDLREDGFKVAIDNIKKFRLIFPSLNINLINRDIFAVLADSHADIIWVRQAISHIHPAEKFIDLAYQSLNKNGLLVMNDSNALNPLAMVQTLATYWQEKRKLTWFVTDQYKDPVTNATVPYAVERILRPSTLKKMLVKSGFHIDLVDITGYVPVSIASKLPRISLRFESIIRKLPFISQIGMEYTIVGKKN